jgi:hypothetical protein
MRHRLRAIGGLLSAKLGRCSNGANMQKVKLILLIKWKCNYAAPQRKKTN